MPGFGAAKVYAWRQPEVSGLSRSVSRCVATFCDWPSWLSHDFKELEIVVAQHELGALRRRRPARSVDKTVSCKVLIVRRWDIGQIGDPARRIACYGKNVVALP